MRLDRFRAHDELLADAAVREPLSQSSSTGLLANSDPLRFDELYAALAPETQALVDELSPLTRIARVSAPVELASSPSDPFFPVDESLALAEAGQRRAPDRDVGTRPRQAVPTAGARAC